MRRFTALVLLLFTGWAPASLAVVSGTELVGYCENASQGAINPDVMTVQGASCVGMVYGVMFTADAYSEDETTGNPRLCLPDNFTVTQGVYIVNKFLRENPELLHHDSSALILFALIKAYGCG